MPAGFFEEKFDEFRLDVIDRLARMETKHDQVMERLDRLNGTVGANALRIAEHDRKFARLRGASSVIAAIVAAAMSAVVLKLRAWLNL
jgi:hypothetical protein